MSAHFISRWPDVMAWICLAGFGCNGPVWALDNNCTQNPAGCFNPPTTKKTCYIPGTVTAWQNYPYSDSAGTAGSSNPFYGFQGVAWGIYVVNVPAGTRAPTLHPSSAQYKDIKAFMNNAYMEHSGITNATLMGASSWQIWPVKDGYVKWYPRNASWTLDYAVYWNAKRNCAYVMQNFDSNATTGKVLAKYASLSYEEGGLGMPTSNPLKYLGGAPSAGQVIWQRFTNGYITYRYPDVAAFSVGGTANPGQRAVVIRYGSLFDNAQTNPSGQNIHPLASDMACIDSFAPGSCTPKGLLGYYVKTYPATFGYDRTIIATKLAAPTQGYDVHGEIENKWYATYGSAPWFGELGFPTSNEQCLDTQPGQLRNGCKYVYSNFQNGHIFWSGGTAAVVGGGPVPAVRQQLVDPGSPTGTFRFSLSKSLKAGPGDPDSDQDGLDDHLEKQLAFITAPRLFWDEDESASENQDFIKYRRLDLVQVRPISGPVSKWASGTKYIVIRFMMEYPLQPESSLPFYHGGHIGDSEMTEVRLYANGSSFRVWDVLEIVFTPHGDSYYGDISTLTTRALALNTPYLWIAVDQNSHGGWGGSTPESEDCNGGSKITHDCFEDGSLAGALTGNNYWWFDPTRDIGEPESLRIKAWPLEGRGVTNTVPQIKMDGPHAAYIENDTGYGRAREYIRYTRGSEDIPTANVFCGWRCPLRRADGQCDPSQPGAENGGYPDCDGGAKSFPSEGQYTNIFPVGIGHYGRGKVGDFTYQLWGNPNILPLLSGDAAREGARASASSTYPTLPPAAAINGDRLGVDWGSITGGWQSANEPTSTAPQFLRVNFRRKTITRIDVFTLRDNYAASAHPTLTQTFVSWGIQNFRVQYCPVASVCTDGFAPLWAGEGWITVPNGDVTGNNKVWRQFSFPPVDAKSLRVHITAAAGSRARITEIEAWE